jgi:Holliday junction resolvase RusA-like endonuclease
MGQSEAGPYTRYRICGPESLASKEENASSSIQGSSRRGPLEEFPTQRATQKSLDHLWSTDFTQKFFFSHPKPMGAIRQNKKSLYNPKIKDRIDRYHAYRDELKRQADQYNFKFPNSTYWMIFYMPIPASLSKKKKREMELEPCLTRPDKDNLEKAVLDALLTEDSHVWDGRVTKVYSAITGIEIYF